MNETINKATGETIKYNRLGGTTDNPIYYSDQPTTNISPSISVDKLTPVNPVNITTPPNSTVASGIIASTANRANQDLIQTAKENVANIQSAVPSQADTENKAILDAIRSTISSQNAVDTAQATAEKTAIEPLQKTLSDINTQIADQNVAYRAEQDRIRATPMSEAQKSVELGNIEDTYGRRIADLSIRQSAARGNITDIQNNFDRQTKLLQAPLQRELDFATQYRQKYADTLTAKESKQLDQVISEKNRLLQETKDLQDAKAKVVAEVSSNGGGNDQATLSAIQDAQDITSAYTAGAKYIGSLDRAVKLANLQKTNAEIRKLNAESAASQIPQVNNNAAKYKGALDVILGSGKFTKEQKASIVNAVNNGEDPVAVVKNQAKSILGQTESTTLTKYEVAKASLNDISDSLKQFYANGGSTSLLSGTTEQVINKLGEVSDPKLVDIATQIAANIQVYRNAVSGTAYSVQEGRQIDSIFPGINKSQGLNEAIVKGRNKSFDSVIDATYRSALGSTYDSLKKIDTPTETPTAVPQDIITGIATALTANYTPQQIVDTLKNNPKVSDKIQAALNANYTPQEIINYLQSFK